ncbi:hypothetical protein PENTCL1PPCAC_17152, partial [Pristionchus entomophagus]
LFVFVLRANRRNIEKLKRSGSSYSVARSFQLQENVAILTLLTRSAKPILFCTTTAFILFCFYAFVPPNSGYDTARFFSVALYDLWLAKTSVILVLCLPYYEPKFGKNISCTVLGHIMRRNTIADLSRQESNADAVTNAYFNQLARHWENPI